MKLKVIDTVLKMELLIFNIFTGTQTKKSNALQSMWRAATDVWFSGCKIKWN